MANISLSSIINRIAALGLLGAAWLTTGCGGIGPGDYMIYRVAYSGAKTVCVGDEPNANEASDTNTFVTSSVLHLYAGADDKFFLEMGDIAGISGTSLAGSADGDVYTFSGKSFDVDFSDPSGQGDKSERTVTTNVKMTVDGAAVSGTLGATSESKFTCADPTNCQPERSCATTVQFSGSEVEDVELQHDPG